MQKSNKLQQFKQWILSIVRRSYSFEDMERAYEEGIYEGTLRQIHKEKGTVFVNDYTSMIVSDMMHYRKLELLFLLVYKTNLFQLMRFQRSRNYPHQQSISDYYR